MQPLQLNLGQHRQNERDSGGILVNATKTGDKKEDINTLRKCFSSSSIVHQSSACGSHESGLDVRPSSVLDGLNTRTRVNSITVFHSLKAFDGFSPRTTLHPSWVSVIPSPEALKSHDHPDFSDIVGHPKGNLCDRQ
jgi:hypothetical protein